MKQVSISILLFLLLTGLMTLMDLIQGLKMADMFLAFSRLIDRLGAEEYLLLVTFFLPLIISKVNTFRKNKQL